MYPSLISTYKCIRSYQFGVLCYKAIGNGFTSLNSPELLLVFLFLVQQVGEEEVGESCFVFKSLLSSGAVTSAQFYCPDPSHPSCQGSQQESVAARKHSPCWNLQYSIPKRKMGEDPGVTWSTLTASFPMQVTAAWEAGRVKPIWRLKSMWLRALDLQQKQHVPSQLKCEHRLSTLSDGCFKMFTMYLKTTVYLFFYNRPERNFIPCRR